MNRNINTCLAGEYYVAAILHKNGWTANLTLKNYPDIDIFGYNPNGNKHSLIQVKSGCNKYNVLTGLDTQNFKNKIGDIKQNYVFVRLNSNGFECFILKNSDFINLATSLFNSIKSVSAGKKAPIKFKWSVLMPFKDQWQNLW